MWFARWASGRDKGSSRKEDEEAGGVQGSWELRVAWAEKSSKEAGPVWGWNESASSLKASCIMSKSSQQGLGPAPHFEFVKDFVIPHHLATGTPVLESQYVRAKRDMKINCSNPLILQMRKKRDQEGFDVRLTV